MAEGERKEKKKKKKERRKKKERTVGKQLWSDGCR